MSTDSVFRQLDEPVASTDRTLFPLLATPPPGSQVHLPAPSRRRPPLPEFRFDMPPTPLASVRRRWQKLALPAETVPLAETEPLADAEPQLSARKSPRPWESFPRRASVEMLLPREGLRRSCEVLRRPSDEALRSSALPAAMQSSSSDMLVVSARPRRAVSDDVVTKNEAPVRTRPVSMPPGSVFSVPVAAPQPSGVATRPTMLRVDTSGASHAAAASPEPVSTPRLKRFLLLEKLKTLWHQHMAQMQPRGSGLSPRVASVSPPAVLGGGVPEWKFHVLRHGADIFLSVQPTPDHVALRHAPGYYVKLERPPPDLTRPLTRGYSVALQQLDTLEELVRVTQEPAALGGDMAITADYLDVFVDPSSEYRLRSLRTLELQASRGRLVSDVGRRQPVLVALHTSRAFGATATRSTLTDPFCVEWCRHHKAPLWTEHTLQLQHDQWKIGPRPRFTRRRFARGALVYDRAKVSQADHMYVYLENPPLSAGAYMELPVDHYAAMGQGDEHTADNYNAPVAIAAEWRPYRPGSRPLHASDAPTPAHLGWLTLRYSDVFKEPGMFDVCVALGLCAGLGRLMDQQ